MKIKETYLEVPAFGPNYPNVPIASKYYSFLFINEIFYLILTTSTFYLSLIFLVKNLFKKIHRCPSMVKKFSPIYSLAFFVINTLFIEFKNNSFQEWSTK